MASFGRSLKPTLFLTSMGRRPGMPGRSLSNTSEVSSTALSPGEFNADDILFAAKPSPAATPGASRRPGGDMHTKTVAQDPAPLAPSDAEADADSPASLLPLDSPSSSVRSRPIAIELPVPKKITSNHSVSVYTPPAPLSARGDLPGGYFPLHEDQNRVYRGHPFQPDASQARKRSIQLASETIPLETHSLQPAPAPPAPAVEPQPATQYFPVAAPGPALSSPAPTTDGMSPSRSTTPVASYIPSGVHANPLPMGKYYPSNYEKRREEKLQQQVIRPSPSGNLATSVKSDSQVPTFRSDSSMGHSRNESEAKRRLQQYQRDMIAQATLALNGGNVNAAALNAISLRNMGFTSLNTKPSKPRLVPLGSPGPVTPMELESSDDGYLGARVPASEDSTQIEEIARAIRIEEERRRREGTTSPAIELGPAC